MKTNDPKHVMVDRRGLEVLGTRPPFSEYVTKIWGRRHFIWTSARSQVRQNHRDMILGKSWMVLAPLIDAAMYGVIFGLLLRTSRGIDNFLGYLVIGVIFMRFMTQGLTSGGTLISGSKNMIRSFSFPRASLVFSAVLRQAIDNIIPAVVAIAFALASQIGTPLSWTIIFVFPLYVLLHVFVLGLTFIVSRIAAFFPDAKQLIRVMQRGWFYISGVFFSVERFATIPILQEVMVANPAYQFLQAFRGSVMYGEVPTLSTILYLFAWSFGTLLIGFMFFWRAEERYVNVE